MTATQVGAHAGWFASDEAGVLTDDSMREKHHALRIQDGVDFKISAIRGLWKSHRPRCPFTAGTIASILNPAKSGLWDDQGMFDEQKFEILANSAVRDAQKQPAVTREMFAAMVGQRPGSGARATIAWLFYIIPIPVSWLQISNASLDDLFHHFSDTTINGERALTLSKLRFFYTDPKGFFDNEAKRAHAQSANP